MQMQQVNTMFHYWYLHILFFLILQRSTFIFDDTLGMEDTSVAEISVEMSYHKFESIFFSYCLLEHLCYLSFTYTKCVLLDSGQASYFIVFPFFIFRNSCMVLAVCFGSLYLIISLLLGFRLSASILVHPQAFMVPPINATSPTAFALMLPPIIRLLPPASLSGLSIPCGCHSCQTCWTPSASFCHLSQTNLSLPYLTKECAPRIHQSSFHALNTVQSLSFVPKSKQDAIHKSWCYAMSFTLCRHKNRFPFLNRRSNLKHLPACFSELYCASSTLSMVSF